MAVRKVKDLESINDIVITRFAPSPTGMLHIGSARTALFNWIYARKNNGKFLLRIEDTDKKRYSDESLSSIIDGLEWLGLDFDDEIYLQSNHINEHIDVAKRMVDSGYAYFVEDDNVIRLKVPDDEIVSFFDIVYGEINVHSSQIEDTVLVRSDGTPTFILSMSVDDYNMGITTVIRGSDHINNALKQKLIFSAMGWRLPQFAHIPLIHNESGAKLSKRDGAASVMEYKELGFLPEAMKNYLLRLGWGNQDHEIIDESLALELFTLDRIRSSPACFDMMRLEHINHYYINSIDNDSLFNLVIPLVKKLINREIAEREHKTLFKLVAIFKDRAHTLVELVECMRFYFFPHTIDDLTEENFMMLKKISVKDLIIELQNLQEWNKQLIDVCLKAFAKENEIQMRDLYVALRVIVMGVSEAPNITTIVSVIDKDDFLHRVSFFID